MLRRKSPPGAPWGSPHGSPRGSPPENPGGNWLAGIVIGSAIMTMATQAMLIGAGAAIAGATIPRS